MKSAERILGLYGMGINIKKYNVQFYEVVSAFDDPDGYDGPDPQGYPTGGCSQEKALLNRILVIIYIPEDAEIHRLITAYEGS